MKFIKINTEDATSIAADQGVTVLPTFHIFKAGVKVAEYQGSDAAKFESVVRANV